METMHIAGVGTALPENRYAQGDCWEVLRRSEQFGGLKPRSQAILRKVLLGDNGIETRHLCLNSLQDAFDLRPDAMQERFVRNAPRLAVQAAERALERAGAAREEMDAVVVSTCTGYLCPGLSSYVIERLGLRADIAAFDLVGQGCGAALPNLGLAAALTNSGASRTLSICVEVCSAAIFLDDDPGVLISACLFGDGAAAVVGSSGPGPGRRIRWLGKHSLTAVEDRDSLRFEHREGMLRNILSPQVPGLAAKHVERLYTVMMAGMGEDGKRVSQWLLHPGGRDILVRLKERLQLKEEDVAISAEVLRRCGNMSSPSVLFVLEQAIAADAPAGRWWMASFGAGFSCHGAFLEVEA